MLLGAHGLDHDEGIALADGPDLLLHLCKPSRVTAGAREKADQINRVGAGKRRQGHLGDPWVPAQLIQGAPRRRGVRQLIFAAGRHEQQAPAWDAQGQEGKQSQAHFVGPVHVLEHQYDQLPGRQVLHETGHAFEEMQVVVAWRRKARTVHLGEQPGQLCAPDRIQRPERLVITKHSSGAAGGDPRAEGQHLGALIGASEQHARSRGAGVGRESPDQAGLADPRLAHHQHEPAASRTRVDEGGTATRDFPRPTDEGDVGRPCQALSDRGTVMGPAFLRPPAVRNSHAASMAENLLVDLARVGFRLDAKLAPEDTDAHLVLPEGTPASAELNVEAHQRPVDGFLKRIEGDEPERGLQGGFRQPGGPLMNQQLSQRVQGEFPQPLPLRHQPFLEERPRKSRPSRRSPR